jgi:hypothetical protein
MTPPFPTTSLFIAVHETDIIKTAHINITATNMACPFCNSLIRCLSYLVDSCVAFELILM